MTSNRYEELILPGGPYESVTGQMIERQNEEYYLLQPVRTAIQLPIEPKIGSTAISLLSYDELQHDYDLMD